MRRRGVCVGCSIPVSSAGLRQTSAIQGQENTRTNVQLLLENGILLEEKQVKNCSLC